MAKSVSELLQNSLAVTGDWLEPVVELTTTLTQISAPSNDELDRSHALEQILRERGYDDIQVDTIGNVTARIAGKDRSKCLLIAAHIDTVFPREVDLTVKRDAKQLHGPGIGDNTVAVASVVMLKEILERLGETPAIDLVITGNVGEEGLGDLRGMKAVVSSMPDMVGAIAVEGQALGSITYEAVGSRRYRVTVTGQGGHSWGQAGTPSAIHHLAHLIAAMDQVPLTKHPKTSFNAGVIHGGISVNTIAPEVEAILDMRSTSADALENLVRQIDEILNGPCPDGVAVRVETVGDRPAGTQPKDGALISIAEAVLSELGLDIGQEPGSTDANVPIAAGIPAICIGLTTGGNAHREDEYIDIAPIPTGIAHLITVILKGAEALA